jgi:hypothetical protein
MRDADETIKVLMAGFRDAEPPSGMQGRIFQALELHATVSRGSLVSWRLRPSVAMAFVCVAVLMVALAIRIPRPLHRSANVTGQVTHVDARQGVRPETTTVKTSAGLRRKAPRGPATGPRESELASYPAPPLPLTEQERLLLRLAHRDDVQSDAMLNPGLQAAASAEAAKQFQEFFAIDAKEMRNESE